MSHFPLETRRPLLQDIFTYPIRGGGKYILIIGGVLSVISELCKFAPMFGGIAAFLLFGYFCAVFFEIVQTSATGGDEAPYFPELSNIWEDLILPALRVWVVGLVSFLPWILATIFLRMGLSSPLSLALLGFAALYYPMAILAVSILGYMGAVSPHIVLPAICRAGGLYWLAVFLLTMVLMGQTFLAGSLHAISPILGNVIMCLIGMYTLMANGRTLGIVYRERSEELNWV
jgi:hypothetical protein